MSLNKVIERLNLNRIGLVELLIALYPILSSYQYGPVPLSLFVLLLVMGLVILKNNKITFLNNRTFKILSLYVIIHDILLIFVMGNNTPSFFFNSLIALVLTLFAIFLVTPYIRWDKLVGAINWVSIICVIGMTYQYLQVRGGQSVGMLKLPLLPESGLARYIDLYDRPHSFFEEPAMYSQFMLVPMFIALIKKQYVWSGIIALTVLMSSSTTGLILVFVQFLIVILLGETAKKSKIILCLIGCGMAWMLFNTDTFSAATDKFTHESEHSVENVRLVQGPAVVSTMEFSDYFLGAPYANAYQYCIKRGISLELFEVYGKGDDAMVYMTTIWQLILHFGVVGALLYIMVYVKLLKERKILPLLICYIIMIITAAFWFGPYFAFYNFIIFSFLRKVNKDKEIFAMRLDSKSAKYYYN